MQKFLLFGAVAIGVSAVILIPNPGETQSAGSFVALQAVTPGTAQSGNLHISGTARVGGFVLPTGGGVGKVLGSNASGVGAWQNDGLTLPFAGSGSSGLSVFSITNGSTGNAVAGSCFNGTGISGTTGIGNGVFGSAINTSGFGGFFENTATGNAIALKATAAGTGPAILGEAAGGIGVQGNGSKGVYGTAIGDNSFAVYGLADLAALSARGGHFSALGPGGVGVFGTGNAFGGAFSVPGTGTAVDAVAPYVLGSAGIEGRGATGIHGTSNFPGGYGVRGTNLSGSGGSYGVYGETQSLNAAGVFGIAHHASGDTSGGSFLNQSTSGTGVKGRASAATGSTFGGHFTSASSSGIGAFAESPFRALHGRSTGASGISVLGESTSATGTTYGGYFTSASTNGGALFASASNTTGDSYGVQGLTAAPSGVGVYAIATATTGAARGLYAKTSAPGGAGIISLADATSGTTYGGYFLCGSTNGTGVYSQASAGTGQTAGGYFQSDSTAGTGLIGWASAATGSTKGVYGEAASTTGIGVMGESFATSGVSYGVFGEADSSSGRGVYGFASHLGAGAAPYGVRGEASTLGNGYGVYANGDMGASGVKPFRIDHPLDPENKYLLHFSSESPFPQNFYNGNVTTDTKGYAWVQLPEYFEDVNTNFKYVLTIVDDGDSADFAQAKVSKKILGNQFQIRTNSPRVTVSWMVFADRNDRRIRYNRPTDERDKTGDEKGKYQHPEYYDLPPSMSMDYRKEQVRKRVE